MLSRVAAVKAPRAHNRRRVTGSSGRRREGRESEPRRPNMSRRVFTFAVLLLVLVMMCCGSGAAQVVVEEPSSDPQFEWKDIKDGDGVTVDSLGAPSLLKVGNDVFAVAEVQCKKKDDVSFTGIASQPLTKKTAKTPEEVLEKPKDGTQVLEENASKDQKKKVDVSRPTTAVKGNDIYMLVGQYGSKVASSGEDDASDAAQLGLLLVKGSVNSEVANKKKLTGKLLKVHCKECLAHSSIPGQG
ncbi:trans-sialidase [Trypanosoma cruzi Dm28c]|uniref:Trans-sialidase n=1 Tax=Trypanosoma cruzi Dm28c TaxID=1416333 RepID=V5D2N6_TRYCR|nr:trans-sialidase [Trypanosoma cruzi Dm28c]